MANKQEKKPRKLLFNLGVNQDSQVEIFWDAEQQLMKFNIKENGKPVKPVNTIISTYYDRQKKIKILNQTSSSKTVPIILNPDEILARFDAVLAVDTNSVVYGNHKISVCCLVSGIIEKKEKRYSIVAAPRICLEFWNSIENPEKFAWRKIVQMLQNHKDYSDSKNYALIVDSFLSDIPRFNLGEPIIDGFKLPRNIEMIYASTDAGNESILNRLLALSDKEAKKLLKFICQYNEDIPMMSTEENGCSHFRIWHRTLDATE